MLSNRYIRFQSYFPEDEDSIGCIKPVWINPMKIDSFYEAGINYTTIEGDTVDRTCLVVQTGPTRYILMVSADEFMDIIDG